MDFVEKNKVLIVQIAAGVLLALVLDWLDLPVWLIGAGVAALIAMFSGQLVDGYDRHIAPRINAARKRDI